MADSQMMIESPHRYQGPIHSRTQFLSQSPFLSTNNNDVNRSPEQQRKRRLSGSPSPYKKTKPEEPLTHSTPTRCEYPVFQHPRETGGVVQQTPYGMVKVTRQGKVETTTLEKDMNVHSFGSQMMLHQVATRLVFDDVTTTTTQQQPCEMSRERMVLPKTTTARLRLSPSPSPSAEIEGYMMEGYGISGNATLNKSYRYHEEEILNVNYGLYDDFNECDDYDEEMRVD